MSKVSRGSDSSPLSEGSWPSMEAGAVESWSVDEVSRFLERNGFSQYKRLLCEDHSIDGQALLTLTEHDLRNDPLRIPVLGDIKRLAICISALQNANLPVIQHLLPHTVSPSTTGLSSGLSTGLVNPICSGLACGLHCRSSNSLPTSIKRQPLPFPKPLKHASCKHEHEYEHDHDTDTDEYSDTSETDPEEVSKEAPSDRSDRSNKSTNGKSTSRNFTNYRSVTNGNSRNGRDRDRGIRQESWKALVAMFYFFCVTWITAFVMVIVHDRVPDMATYPPLPDIFLDNVPLIPWAFQMCELCGLILFIMWCKILVFHKYRFILLRRMFSLFGSVFLLRCVTMLITSLSVPGRHLECKARPYGSWTERLVQAYVIWQGGGMSLQGVRTCGDYMFSGHTVVLTLLNFFITEYTPASLYYVHTLSWVLNLFGIFFILAGHEHYSIDVFIAFYISTRLFLYYHTLANNRALYQPDRRRTKVWFPLFSFFESGVNGIVPNQFDCNISFRSLSNLILKFRHKIKYFKQKNNGENNNLLRNNQLVNDDLNAFHPKSN